MSVDVMKSIIDYLNKTEIVNHVSSRIYGGEIPRSEIGNMPRKCVVVKYAGGSESFRSDRISNQRIHFFSYGETFLECSMVDSSLVDVLHALRREDISNALLHSVGYGGATQMKDGDTGWPLILRTSIIKADERKTN